MRIPEILAPAGDAECLHVALEAGADTVYFGLDDGFNARARATNFPIETLPDVVARVHRAGARAYLTMNTVVFEPELELVEPLIRAAARAGVDALIVQDPGLALLARAICPALRLHASTQMTLSCPESARFAEGLGFVRLVAPRELSVDEIRTLVQGTTLEVEVFVLGALCIAWSGQCLSSEAWGGRSANRGQCAQACRLPYEAVVDGQVLPTGERRYLLSPRDLAGFRAVPHLLESGVHALKIEGRQKGPAYVHAATSTVRRWVDAVARGVTPEDERRLAEDLRNLSLTFSRGFGDGFLAGSDHQALVDGRAPKHRGILLGQVAEIRGDTVRVSPPPPREDLGKGQVRSPLPVLGGSPRSASGPGVAPLEIRAGMGVVFDQGHPEEPEEGGPVFTVRSRGLDMLLSFGRPGPDLSRVRPGARVWVTGDPELAARASRSLRLEPAGRRPVAIRVWGRCGEPLEVEARSEGGIPCRVRSTTPLAQARGRALDAQTLREKLGAFGGTPFILESLEADELEPGLFLPLSELKPMRRDLVEALTQTPAIPVAEDSRLETVRQELLARIRPTDPRGAPDLVALCRTPEHLRAAIAVGQREVELDWMDFNGLEQAVNLAREEGLRVGLATLRVQKPGEEGTLRHLEALNPDSVLVRHWGGVMHFSETPGSPAIHGDFSLNVTNSLTACHLLALGLQTVTAAHDLDEEQLLALLQKVPRGRVAVTIHHHIPTFHTQHCSYARLLSQGRDRRTCGQPCRRHDLALRDRLGNEHPVLVDAQCRNTVFNAAAQSAAFLVPRLMEAGVRRMRVEFVRETRVEAERILEAYRDLLAGRLEAGDLTRLLGAHEQFGVTRGALATLASRPGPTST
jgi:putative protease